ncbi:MAG: hypothetical protein K2L11_02425 [Muribaculaceae bacterium]|nr:hypothetical protein [Muribaculaceae bacterium]
MKKANKIIFTGVLPCLAIAGYAAFSVIPNIFYKKNYSPSEIRNLIVVAHRGGAALGPENSLYTIEKGMAAGADMIEIDIHQTLDGQLVVCHDQSLDRTTNGKGLIRDLTLEQIRKYRLLDSNGQITDQKIPTFEEVLDLIDGKVKLLVEIKRTGNIYQGIEDRMVAAIKSHNAESWTVAQSFDDSVLENLHAIDSSLRLEKLWVCKMAGLPLGVGGTLSEYSYEKYDYVSSFNFFYHSVTKSMVDDIHRHGKEVKIWTVGSPEETPHLPVDGIITNYPHLWK